MYQIHLYSEKENNLVVFRDTYRDSSKAESAACAMSIGIRDAIFVYDTSKAVYSAVYHGGVKLPVGYTSEDGHYQIVSDRKTIISIMMGGVPLLIKIFPSIRLIDICHAQEESISVEFNITGGSIITTMFGDDFITDEAPVNHVLVKDLNELLQQWKKYWEDQDE